jgi:hypothetical protein
MRKKKGGVVLASENDVSLCAASEPSGCIGEWPKWMDRPLENTTLRLWGVQSKTRTATMVP